MTPWLRETAEGVVLAVHAQPGAKKTEVAGRHGDALKIRLAAPPVDGKANDTLLAYLSDCLSVPRAAIRLISGETSRQKRVLIAGQAGDHVRAVLLPE